MAVWWKRAAAGLATSAILAGGMATLGAAPASADAGTAAAAPGASCTYDGREYSDGAVVKVGDVYIQCRNGTWIIIHPTVPVPVD